MSGDQRLGEFVRAMEAVETAKMRNAGLPQAVHIAQVNLGRLLRDWASNEQAVEILMGARDICVGLTNARLIVAAGEVSAKMSDVELDDRRIQALIRLDKALEIIK